MLYYIFTKINYDGLKYAKDIGESLAEHVSLLNTNIQEYTNSLKDTCDKIGMQNNGRFVPRGFIGLQEQANMLEKDPNFGSDYVRKAVLSHLPSYMRLNDLSEERGKLLFYNWEPPNLIPKYVEITNKRKEALKQFIERNGIVREIYDANKISRYVRNKFTFHDNIKDPVEEIKERLKALLHYLGYQNFYLGLIKDEYTGPRYILKNNVGLLIDLRSTEIDAHFTKSIDGIYTEAPELLNEFDRKFSNIWKSKCTVYDKEINRNFINDLLVELDKRSDIKKGEENAEIEKK